MEVDTLEARRAKMLARLAGRHAKTTTKAEDAPKSILNTDELLAQATGILEAENEQAGQPAKILALIEALARAEQHESASRTISRIHQTVDRLRARLSTAAQNDARGFAFSAGTTTTTLAAGQQAEESPKHRNSQKIETTDAASTSLATATRMAVPTPDGGVLFAGKEDFNGVIRRPDGEDSKKAAGTLTITDCKRCRLGVAFRPTAVFLANCEDCTIVLPSIGTSCAVRRLERCVVAVRAQQIRLFGCRALELHCDVRAAVVLEESSQVALAPYNVVVGGGGEGKDDGEEGEKEEEEEGFGNGAWRRPHDFDALESLEDLTATVEGDVEQEVQSGSNWRILAQDKWRTFRLGEVP